MPRGARARVDVDGCRARVRPRTRARADARHVDRPASDDARFPAHRHRRRRRRRARATRARRDRARLAKTSCARVDRDDDSRDARWGGRDERERARRDGGERLALAMTLAGVDGEAASAATARGGRSWAQSRGRFERISRERSAWSWTRSCAMNRSA